VKNFTNQYNLGLQRNMRAFATRVFPLQYLSLILATAQMDRPGLHVLDSALPLAPPPISKHSFRMSLADTDLAFTTAAFITSGAPPSPSIVGLDGPTASAEVPQLRQAGIRRRSASYGGRDGGHELPPPLGELWRTRWPASGVAGEARGMKKWWRYRLACISSGHNGALP